MGIKLNDIINKNAVFAWIGLAVMILLAVPLLAMQISGDIKWGVFDFIFSGLILYAAGTFFVLLTRKYRHERRLVGTVLAFVVIWLWAELAVGLFTNLGD